MTPETPELATTADGKYCCPAAGCDRTFATEGAISTHHSSTHETYIGEDVFGTEAWADHLYEAYLSDDRSSRDIAAEFGGWLGYKTVQSELRRLGLIEWMIDAPRHGSARVLALPHVRTIEDAREEIRRRGESA